VADLAGVSVTTVSFVIYNKSGGNVRMSDTTRQKV
jgi:DNA-binding LacI/PurR family transcriptional regulator